MAETEPEIESPNTGDMVELMYDPNNGSRQTVVGPVVNATGSTKIADRDGDRYLSVSTREVKSHAGRNSRKVGRPYSLRVIDSNDPEGTSYRAVNEAERGDVLTVRDPVDGSHVVDVVCLGRGRYIRLDPESATDALDRETVPEFVNIRSHVQGITTDATDHDGNVYVRHAGRHRDCVEDPEDIDGFAAAFAGMGYDDDREEVEKGDGLSVDGTDYVVTERPSYSGGYRSYRQTPKGTCGVATPEEFRDDRSPGRYVELTHRGLMLVDATGEGVDITFDVTAERLDERPTAHVHTVSEWEFGGVEDPDAFKERHLLVGECDCGATVTRRLEYDRTEVEDGDSSNSFEEDTPHTTDIVPKGRG